MCGIVGIYSETHVASSIYDSLLMLQHRGQDAAGMVVCDETGRLNSRKSMGYVRDAFQQRHMNKLLGIMGLAMSDIQLLVVPAKSLPNLCMSILHMELVLRIMEI